jgi:hypothetical protein
MGNPGHASGEIAGVRRRLVRTNDNAKQSFVMKSTSNSNRFQSGAVAPGESRFEKFETGLFFETSAYAHFGRKLQKIFPVPPESSEPKDVRVLLRRIQAKLNKFPVPGES